MTINYKMKLWLSDRQYIADLDEALVIVTLDENGKEVRWAIFTKDGKEEHDGQI